jgi:hypothetical protein
MNTEDQEERGFTEATLRRIVEQATHTTLETATQAHHPQTKARHDLS